MIQELDEKLLEKPRHVLLTDRDLDLLASLHDHVVLSFRQVWQKFFAGRSAPTVMNRLRRLEANKLIDRIRVPRFRQFQSKKETGVVFQLTTKGRGQLAKARPQMSVHEKCPTLNLYQLDHDLLLVDIADYLLGKYPGYIWINGRYLGDMKGVNKIPDVILKNPNDEKILAIELELTAKSTFRYRQILSELRASRVLTKVIYITPSVTIDRKIISEIEGFQVPEGHVFKHMFYEFLKLEDCLKACG